MSNPYTICYVLSTFSIFSEAFFLQISVTKYDENPYSEPFGRRVGKMMQNVRKPSKSDLILGPFFDQFRQPLPPGFAPVFTFLPNWAKVSKNWRPRHEMSPLLMQKWPNIPRMCPRKGPEMGTQRQLHHATFVRCSLNSRQHYQKTKAQCPQFVPEKV